MRSNHKVHHQTLLSAKVNHSHSQQKQLKIILKKQLKCLCARDDAFSIMNSIKRTPRYQKQFLWDLLAKVKQLGVPTYLFSLSCADLIWKVFPYIINKLIKVVLSDEELKKLSSIYVICYIITHYLFLRDFSINLKYFSKRPYLMVHWLK